MKLNKKWLTAAGMGIALLLTACAAPEDEVVLSIGDYELTQGEYYELLRDEPYSEGFTYGDVVLEQHILVSILEDKYGSKINEEEIDKLVQDFIDGFGSQEDFEEVIQEQNMTEEDIRENTRMQALITEVFKDYYPMEEGQLEELYEDMIPVGTSIRHILVPDEEQAQEVLEKLDAGDDFVEVMEEYSTDEASLEGDGKMVLNRGVFVPEFEEAAIALAEEGEEGKYTEPVKTDYGYHIIQLASAGTKGSFEEEESYLISLHYEKLMYEEPQAYPEIMNELLKEYQTDIEIHDEALKDLVDRILESAELQKQQQEEYEAMLDEQIEGEYGEEAAENMNETEDEDEDADEETVNEE